MKGNNWKSWLVRRGWALKEIPAIVEGLEAQVKLLHDQIQRMKEHEKMRSVRHRTGDPVLARHLKDWLEKEGITQADAADRLKIGRGHLHAMANNKAKASPPLLVRIAEQLNKPVESLIERPKE